jgi:hypothetical protein
MNETTPNKELFLRIYQMQDLPRMLDLIMENVPKLPNYSRLKMDRSRIGMFSAQHRQCAAFCCTVL